MQVGAKAALFAGVILLLGAGAFVRWIAPGLAAVLPRRIRPWVWTGVALLGSGSALEVLDTITRATGSVDRSLIVPYLSETRHGDLVLARLAIAAGLVWLGPRRRWRGGTDNVVFAALGVALLLTISLASHAGAQPGVLPLSADLLHLIGVAGWAGALAYGAWLLTWHTAGFASSAVERAVARLSTGGAWGVAVIVASGVYASLKNLWGPQALTGTPYGRVLLFKLSLVAMVLGVAAVNRWVLIPSLPRDAPAGRLARLVKVESLLLLGVLGVTAALVSQPLPGPAPSLSRPLPFRDTAGPWAVNGALERRDPGRFAIELSLRAGSGAAAPADLPVELTLTMIEHEMAPVHATLVPVRPGTYRGAFFLPMAGQWQMTIHAGSSIARVPIRTEEQVFIQTASPWWTMLPGTVVMLAGLAFSVAGLRRMGAGGRGSHPMLATGIALFLIGVLGAARAARS